MSAARAGIGTVGLSVPDIKHSVLRKRRSAKVVQVPLQEQQIQANYSPTLFRKQIEHIFRCFGRLL